MIALEKQLNNNYPETPIENLLKNKTFYILILNHHALIR